jgi:RNA-binding protein
LSVGTAGAPPSYAAHPFALPLPVPDQVPSPLTSKQRAHLRGLAHALKPLFHVGKEGVTVPAIRAVRDAFNTRELLKVKVLEGAPEPARAVAQALAAEIEDAAVVQVVGRTVTLYRPHPDEPEIRLPK